MANSKKPDPSSSELDSLGEQVGWLQAKLEGANDLVTKISEREDRTKELQTQADLTAQKAAAVVDYSPEAAARYNKELVDLRRELDRIDEELRFLPTDKDTAKSRQSQIVLELQASKRRWQLLEEKLQAALDKKKEEEDDGAEEKAKQEEIAKQEGLSAKQTEIMNKIEMSRDSKPPAGGGDKPSDASSPTT